MIIKAVAIYLPCIKRWGCNVSLSLQKDPTQPRFHDLIFAPTPPSDIQGHFQCHLPLDPPAMVWLDLMSALTL